jgi:hypothetical protein
MFTIKTYGGEVLGHAQNAELARSYADMQCAILHKQVYVYNEGVLIAIYHPSEFGVKQREENK